MGLSWSYKKARKHRGLGCYTNRTSKRDRAVTTNKHKSMRADMHTHTLLRAHLHAGTQVGIHAYMYRNRHACDPIHCKQCAQNLAN